MGCVNRSSSEFKKLAARHNLATNTLELITHKYWLETGNETLFPTDVYIQAQIGNSHYIEKGSAIRTLWNQRYSSSQEFSSFREFEKARREASKFFPQSAIVHYRNSKDNFVLSVKRPIEKANYTKDSFFDEMDNIGSMRDVKVLNLGIERNKPYSIDKVQELYNRFNTDRTSKELADKIFSIAKDLGLSISFNESLPFGTVGRYTNNNTIIYKKSFIERDIMNDIKAPIILHEVLHALSMYALSNQTKNWKRPEALEKFRTEMNSLYQDLKNNPVLKNERGVVDLMEFVAELANPVFRNKIKEIDKQNKANRSFWSRVLDAFKSLLGLHTTSSYYQRSMNALDKALDAFDIDTYMRYNGIKSTLREGYNAEEWQFNSLSDEKLKSKVKEYLNKQGNTQLNNTLDVINKVAESGKWTSEALTTLDNLVTDIENGKVTYQRFPQEASRGMYQGGRANAAASLLLRGSESTSSKNPRTLSERYERDKREQPVQERIIEAWAKATGIWHDNLDTIQGKNQIAEGGEAKVFYNSGEKSVTKSLSTEYFITPQFALDRITLHNTLFPDSALKVIGFGRNSKGEFQFLVEQPFIQGVPATQKEIDDFINKIGFTKSSRDKGHTFTNENLYLSDLHDENVIKTPKGNLVVIDADLRLNTPDLNRGGKYEISNELTSKESSRISNSPLKPQYQGKLIYAQSGTGKSTIADNKTVFDSDYILGNILGVSTETAGFFFKTLSAKQKKAFGEQYRNAIKQLVVQGYTVLTANESLLPDADIVVYNQSPEQTDERVNSDNRALTNRYHAPEYHQNTLSKIKKLKDEDKENTKEYVALDGEHYLSDIISSVDNLHDRTSDLLSDTKQKKSNTRGLEKDRDQIISSFLNEFGISVNLLDNYDGELPLFDALNRVINARSESDITDGVGYAIAFMMQGDPEMQRMIVASHGMTGDYNKRVPIINRTIKNLHPNQNSPIAKQVLKEIGAKIAEELRKSYGAEVSNLGLKEHKNNPIWTIIKNFFTKLGMRIAALGNRNKVLKQEGFFVKDIIEALGREDFTRIKGPRIKEGSTELAQRVDVEQALKDNPFEDNIIRKLGEHGIALAGSTSIALQGSLFRPSENPLHDIDFNAGDNSSMESLDKLLPTIFPKGTIQFSHALPKLRNGDQTVTYVHLSEPFTIKKTGFDTAEFYSKDGKYLGKRVHYDLFLEDGVQGKLLDFFTGSKKESEHGFYKKTINGHEYLLSESNAAMAAKILWARPKDMWDYKNFKRDDFSQNDSEIMDIRRKTISDGTFMMAPNGKQTNLSERQWLQVRTKAFKEWFGDWENNPQSASKVVDENGEPLVVYHSTRADFNTFDLNKSKNGEGLWFKPWRDNSTVVGKAMEKLTQSHDMPVFLNIKNPVIVDKPSGYKSGDIYTREGIDKHSTSDNDGAIGFSNMNVFKGALNISDIKGKNGVELVVFNPNQVKSATDNIGTFSTTDDNIANYEFSKDFINSLSGKDLKQELGLIKQESADYDMLNNIEPEQQKSKKAIPQDFTFEDGTKVKAPFKPNPQQVDALNEMDRFMKSKETSMTLSGYAGTGKTSLMEIIAKKGQMQHKPVMFCASTNKAAAVLNERVSKAGFKADTLNKVFGISVEVDSTKAYNAKNLVNVLKDADIRRGTTVIIDEASMINEENYNILNKIAEENNLKIIYVGDEAQLAPVGEDRISKVFRNGDGKVIRLTQVERTDDNAVLKEATDIRNGKPLSGVSSFNEKGEGVAYISPQHQDAIGDVIQKYVQGLKSNPNYFRVLAFTNKAVSDYNSQIRELLGYDTPIPQRGEPMTGYANWGYNWRTKSYRFINSEAYKVTLVGTPHTVKTTLSNGTPVFMRATPITLEDPMGNTDTFDFMDIKGDASNRNNATLLANEKKMLWAKAKKVAGRQAKAQIYQKINEIDSFLFVNDSIMDDRGNTLQNKVIDFGYAMTVHKSQGSTFTHVLIDDVDISKAGIGNSMANAMEMVDLGEDTSHDMSNAKLRNSEDVDLGDLSDVEVEEPQSNQSNNLKQQLEYVGVSRATDTVTIVSNKIKKEGSPLHPEQSLGATTPSAKESSTKEITSQLIQHIESMGINVLNKDSMQEFLKTHKLQFVQQSMDNTTSLVNSPIGNLQAELTKTKLEYQKIVKELNKADEKAFHNTLYAKPLHTKEGDIKVSQTSQSKESSLIAIQSGDSVFNTVGTNVIINTKKGLLEGALLFPSRALLSSNSNYTRIDNPIRENHAALLKATLEYYIEQGVNKPTTKWRIPGTERLYKRIQNLSDVLGIDVSKYITLEARTVERNELGKTVEIDEERAIIDVKGLKDAIPTLFSNSEFKDMLSELESDRSSYTLLNSTLQQKYRELNNKREVLYEKLQSIEREIRNKEQEESDLPFFMTPQGEVYGFIDKDDNIYLDETKISPEHPIHEYTHLWDRTVQKHNPQLWQRGIDLMKQTSLWKEVLNNDNYGKVWQSMNLSQEKLENLIASEVHARLVGKHGERILNQLSKEKGQSNIIFKLKQWVLDVWKDLKATFSSWSKEDLDNLTLEDFKNMTVRDFTNGVITSQNINNNESNNSRNEQTPSKQQQTSNGGLLADAQTRIQRGSSNDRETQKQGVLSQEDIDRRNKEDRELIEKFAKEQGKWVEDIDTKLEKKYGEKIGHGSESWVYLKDKDTVIKSRSLTGYDTIQNALRSIELHNSLFPETAMKVVGFGTSDGEFTVVFEQPYIGDGIYATNEEIENFIKERFSATKDDSVTGGTSYKSERYLLQDLKPQNVLVRVVNGGKQYQVIDGDFYDNPDYVSTKQQNNDNTQNGEEYKSTDEFRRVQEGSHKFLEKGVSVFQRGERQLDDKDKERIGRVLGGLLGANSNGGWHGVQSHLTHTNKDNSVGHFNVGRVSGKLFHDIFETVRTYLPNGELVDLHDDYSEAKCFVTDDGLCGFAIEPDGNLVSVFSLSPNSNKGFLYAIKDMVRKEGATHLDAYMSSKQPLQAIYAKTLGFHTASTMDYNMEYDHDDIAKNHNNPQVVFMVDHEVTEPKHFDKDSYDEAQQYQLSQLEGRGKEDNSLPTTDSTLNIYAGTNENADLSNFAERPFIITQEVYNELGINVPIFLDTEFENVEGAFQAMKLTFTNDPEDVNDIYTKLSKLSNANGSSARYMGKGIKFLDTTAWDNNSSQIMKVLLKASFSQNPEALQRLLSTGNATLTHNQDKGKWGKEFPRLLMEVREELKKEEAISSNPSSISSTPSLPSASPQRVSLPGYEYFNDLYEDTPVDADWKIPYLKELDNQLSMDNSAEENTNIIKQMDMILQATSEAEYKQDVKDSKKKSTETVLSEYEKLIQQFNNLLDSDEISASEIRHTAELVINEISDEITRLNTEEGLAKELFPSLDTDLDFLSATRKQIVETVGINRLIDRAKKLFSPEISEYDDLDTMSQAWLITDNWDAIMTLASDIFAMNEGFGITKDYSKGNFTTTEESKIDYDNFNNYSNDPDVAAEEGEKDEQEHWQVESRTIDVLNSMSALVRQGIHKCYQLDAEGNKIYSKWGIAERVNPREAVNSILRWSQGALSLNDMIQRLSDKQKQNPWLSQLIERLSDKSGKETDFQSQFYGVFSKHFQLYSVVLQEDGKYYSMTVNSHPALSEAMQSITSLFKIGEHPLFSEGGKINTKLLGSDKTLGKDSDFNLHKALKELQDITKSLKEGNTLDEDMSKTATANIVGVCRSLGYNVTEEMLSDIVNAENIESMSESLMYIVKELEHASQAQSNGNMKDYNPFAFGAEFSIGGKLRNFLPPITDKLEDTAVNAFYDSGKMYQSYVTPSFMTKFFKKFKQEGQSFEDFILDEYNSSEWFKFNAGDGDINKGWRNEWLRILAKDPDARKVFDHKVELNFNKHNYMRNMNDAEYTLSLITEYFSEGSQKGQAMVPAWFRVPIQSNKPSSEFIKFYSYRGNNYKDSIVNGLHNIFLQELSRIQTVLMRNLSKNDPEFITNFDTNGRKFCFLPVFNAYLENSETAMKKRDVLHNEDNTVSSDNNRLATLLQKRIKGEEELTPDEVTELNNLADRVIRQSTENRVQSILNSWESNGILEAAKSIKDIYPSELKDEEANAYIRSQVENFLWNDSFASKNILQLTVTDITFSKNTEDLQKRLAQLHAPGVRGNIFATDYNGNRVSDGKYRTFILKDFDTFKSNIIANISEVFDRRIANAPEGQKAVLMALKESLVGKDGKYTKINVADAQGYSSPSSYRKKALIFGKWSKQAEDIYKKLSKGEYTYTDLETAFQPLKPFVYSKLTKNLGVPNAPIQSMQVPFQAKNAEYLLIMADAILKGEELSRPNLLRAVYRVMEDSEKLMPTKGIDTVQFESAIKSGLQGKMDIYQFREMEGGEEAAYTFMMNQIFKEEYTGNNERTYRNYNTDTFVHETSYENYCLQQEIPEHFKEHSQAHGSQIRMITPSDLDSFTLDEDGNQVENFYEWTEPDGTHRKVNAKEFRKEYEQTIAENIEESINNLAAELHFNSEDKRERNIALSKILQREILSSPRYGVDLIQACSIDRETGEFRIPKGDPIQAKRIEQLINSIIKNRINKQKIAGGPIVQVSNFGTSQQLHIRFNDKQGNLMPLESEYVPSEHDNLSYKEYVKKNQGGIAYFEVFAPIWSNELFEKFSNLDGSINVEAINKVNPELLKMVSYRIPTEDKYSCAPMKVVGFMPREAGDTIMFPYELTTIDDSDFDVDKRYTMRKDIHIKTKRRKDIENELFNIASESYKNAHDGKTNNQWIGEQVRMFLDNPQKMKDADRFMSWLYSQYQQIAYYTDAPISGRTYRDNKIIDMTLAVLTNPMTADKILNPGGFDAPKKMGYMVAAYKNPANEGISWSELQQKSINELKDLCYTEKDLTFADTQVQFYKQNSAAASLIGVFAVNKVAHATLESNDIFLDVSEICGEDDFTIANTTFGGRMQIDTKYDREGNLIGKTLGSLVSASADAVKDPILNLMNVNMTTAGMLNTMLRLGMTFDDAALFLSQSIIERTLNQFNRENLTNYESLDSIIEKWLDAYRKKYNISDTSNINTEPLTTEELVEGLTSNEHEATDYKVLLAFQKMRALTNAMRKPTFATRFNSISSAVGPLIVDNLIMEHKMEQFLDVNSEDGTHFYTHDGVPVDIDDIFFDHPILKQFSKTVDIAKALFSDMPTGSIGFRNLLKSLPEDIADKMYSDKKLLDQFSNFYQSYLLIQSGMIKPKQLKNYVDEFPKWFSEQNFKEKYEDNALIQAIRLNVSKKTGRPFLQINITGMDEQAKEELRNAWIDLHKADPKLSQMLFNYSFFRAGIGFSPKTFMTLVPTYVKERLKSEDGKASYVDTYRNFPTVVPDIVIDQFIRNNWNNNKLVPMKGGKGTHYDIDTKKGRLLVYRSEDMADLAGLTYMKTKNQNGTYLWHLKSSEKDRLIFELISPLGSNGEYLEMSTSMIEKPLNATTQTSEDSTPSEIKTDSPQESAAEETSKAQVVTSTEQAKKLSALADLIMLQNPKLDKEGALKTIENIKEHERMFTKFLQKVFKHKGLDLNEEEALKEFRKYC